MPGAGHQTRCGAWPWCSCGVSTNFVTWARWISIFFHHVRLNRNLIEFGRVFRQNAFRKDVFLCSQGKEWRIGGVERRNLQRNSRFRAKILNHQVFWFLLLLFLGNNVFFFALYFSFPQWSQKTGNKTCIFGRRMNFLWKISLRCVVLVVTASLDGSPRQKFSLKNSYVTRRALIAVA